MERRLFKKTGVRFLVVVLATILVSGGLLAACSRTQTSTATTATTSATSTTTTVKPTATSTATTATTSATTTTTTATTSATSTTTTVSAADFYKNNVVAVVCPYAPGGTTDFAARMFANWWTQITGGRMVVENREGAGGLIGTNYVYAAKPDGLTIGEGIKGNIVSQVVARDPAMKYDYKKMNWIQFINAGVADALVVGAKSPYNSMQDLMKATGLKFASSQRTNDTTLAAGLIIDMFGLKDAKIVLGYGGATEMQLAAAKGEVDVFDMGAATVLDGIAKGYTKQPFLTLDLVRSTYFPNVPAVPEVIKLSPEHETLLRTYGAFLGGQVFWLQPGVPQDRIDFVRNAFDKIVALDEFKKLALTKWPIAVPPVAGKDFAAVMEKTMAAATPERFAQLQALADKYSR